MDYQPAFYAGCVQDIPCLLLRCFRTSHRGPKTARGCQDANKYGEASALYHNQLGA
jgi:hypothetical protein